MTKKLKVGRLARIVRSKELFMGSYLYYGRKDNDNISRFEALFNLSDFIGETVMVLKHSDGYTKRTVLVLLGEERVWMEPVSLEPLD